MLNKMRKIRFITILVTFLIRPGLQVEDYNDEEFQSSDAAIHKFWGIQDVTITVGKLLHCKIPPDAFKGSIVSYDIDGEDGKSLPKWMVFDKEAAVLEGVPSEKDIGDVRINVKAFDKRGHYVSDMFVVEVYPLLEKNTNNKRKCKKGEEVNMVAIIIEKNINEFTPIQKIRAIQALSAHLDIPINTLLLLPAKFIEDVETDSLLNVRIERDIKNLNRSILTWQVGCNEKIWAEKLKDVKLVKKYVNDGVLSKVLQLPLIESRLLSSPNPFRLRRNVRTNSTEKTDSESIDDDIDNDGDDVNEDGTDAEEEPVPEEIEGTLPIPPEIISSTLSEHFQATSVSAKPVEPTLTADNGARKHKADEIPLLGNNLHPDDMDDGTEAPEDEEILASNSSFYGSIPTAELPSSVTSNNGTVISVTPGHVQSVYDNVTVGSKRYPPLLMHNMPPIIAVAGKRYKLSIDENTFRDEEDGNTRNLTLKLSSTEEGMMCPPWIEFDSEKQEILLLPWIDSISNHDFTIEAIDSDGMTANNTFTVAVQYPPTAQRILDRIAKLYGDVDADNIRVRNVSCNPFVLTWTNNSLPYDTCDNTTISNLLNVLTDGERNTNVNQKVRQELSSLVEVEKVTWKGIGLCQDILIPRQPAVTKLNSKPVVGKVRVDLITARVGELTVFKIPEGAFYYEHVTDSDLKIIVLTIDHTVIPIDNWLQFDATNRELYGLPMHGDVGSTKYQMECLGELNGDAARQVFDVVVEPASRIPYNIEFTLVLKMSFEEFSKSPSKRRLFVEKLASLFDDRNTSSIVISSYTPGSVVVTWYNKSLPIDKCQETAIEQLRRVLLDDEGNLNEDVNRFLSPDFEIKYAQITPIGICEGGLTELHSTEINAPASDIHAIPFSETLFSYLRAHFFEGVLPVLIILTMILLAGLVACILYRRQRRAKWTLGDEDDRRTYRNKGIPVIFQDELEERLEPTNKSPIIMKEEKPPLPPPEYQKTLPMATTALLSDFDDPSYQQGSITFTSQADRNGRSKVTPTYRKPPPYVPP